MFAKTIFALCSFCAIISCFPLPCLLYIFNFLFFLSLLIFVLRCNVSTKKKKGNTRTRKRNNSTHVLFLLTHKPAVLFIAWRTFSSTRSSRSLFFFLLKRRQHTKNKEPFFSVDLLSFASKYTLLLPTVAFPCSCFLFFLLIN